MLTSLLLIAWRNLIKQKALSVINVCGLSMGIACFSLFLLYTLNEFTFDGFHRNANNLYRVYADNATYHKNLEAGSFLTPMPVGGAMKKDLPGVIESTRFVQSFETFLRQGNLSRREFIAFADPSFFKMFSFRFREGNPSTALVDPNGLVVTAETAKRLFGNEKAMGKTIEVKIMENEFQPFTVTGVTDDIPANSSLSFNMLVNFHAFETTTEGKGDIGNWNRNSFQTFVLLQPGSNLPNNEAVLSDFSNKYLPQHGHFKRGFFALEPLTQMHTDTGFSNIVTEKIPPVPPFKIWMLLSISGGVLLISCINFTTLSVGRSARRAREVGVRKVMGGSANSIRRQFFLEAFLLTVIAFALGYGLSVILLPLFNQFAGRNLTLSMKQYPGLVGLYVALILVVTILAGAYPAFMMSRFSPVDVLKSKVKFGGENFFTKSLVTLQFTLSAGLIIGAIIMLQQLKFVQSRNPGFDKENVVVIEARNIPETKRIFNQLKQRLAKNPAILGLTSAEHGLGDHEGTSMTEYKYDGKDFTVYPYFIDPDYVRVLGLKVMAGRNLTQFIAEDTTTSVLINEAMVKALGWTPVSAIGKPLNGMRSGDTTAPPIVTGVVSDMNFLSMERAVEPQMFHAFAGGMPYRFFVRIRPGDPSKSITAIEREWAEVAPGFALRYNFLDEDLNRFYSADLRMSKIIFCAGGISILLACLGLFGLAMLTAINRTKEIGVRKVLGASSISIVRLVATDFLRLIALALLIATPLAWYCMNQWLENYHYRIQLSFWVFGLTAAAIVGMAAITIATQAVRAAQVNPVKSLRTE